MSIPKLEKGAIKVGAVGGGLLGRRFSLRVNQSPFRANQQTMFTWTGCKNHKTSGDRRLPVGSPGCLV